MKSSVSLLVVGACALFIVQPTASHLTPARGETARAAASVGAFVAKLPAPMQVSMSPQCDPVTQPVAGPAPLRVLPTRTQMRAEKVVVVPPDGWWEVPLTGTPPLPPEPCVPVATWSDAVLSA